MLDKSPQICIQIISLSQQRTAPKTAKMLSPLVCLLSRNSTPFKKTEIMAVCKDAEDEMVLCLCVSDLLCKDLNPHQLYLRKSPFATPIENDTSSNITEFVQYDKENNIYYLPIGVEPDQLAFPTDRYRWPDKYTILIWIRWAKNSSITVFDSSIY